MPFSRALILCMYGPPLPLILFTEAFDTFQIRRVVF